MSNNTSIASLQQLDIKDDIFAPVPVNKIGTLLNEYLEKRDKIHEMASVLSGNYRDLVEYFMEPGTKLYVERFFDAEKAIKSLNSDYWQKALMLTDIYNIMPQKRRDEWNLQITSYTTPEFEAATVIPTLEGLLRLRPQFLAERVDGIFRSLSREHITNRPEGFSKRMIIAHLLDFYGSLHSVNYSTCGYINDLRCVIAKIMGRDEPNYNQTSHTIQSIYRKEKTGQWFDLDGGAFRLRIFKKGTAHIEVHPDIAWKLNSILAHLHPLAIPSNLRTKPSKRKGKEVSLVDNLIPFKVLSLIQDVSPRKDGSFSTMSWHRADKHLREAAKGVLESLGGVFTETGTVSFDYDVTDILKQVLLTGTLPDQKSYQYYPTPKELAIRAVEWAEIGEDHLCLEPSAGQGGIANFLPESRTTCVEVSRLHCDILRTKGFNVVESDFILWSNTASKFDRIVMNPPFSEGRWEAHVRAAASLLRPEGVLVAILPSSAKGMKLEGLDLEWSEIISGSLFGVGVSLIMLKCRKV